MNAFGVIATSCAFFAGFAFNGLLMGPYSEKNDLHPKILSKSEIETIQTAFNLGCAITMLVSVSAMLYCKFLALFSMRYALRGGDGAVENAIILLRREYRGCIYILTVGARSSVGTDSRAIIQDCRLLLKLFVVIVARIFFRPPSLLSLG